MYREEMLVALLGAFDLARVELPEMGREAVTAGAPQNKAAALTAFADWLRRRAGDIHAWWPESEGSTSARLDHQLRLDLLELATRRAATACIAERALGEEEARVVLRLLRSIPLVVAPPYIPVELPWLRRTPSPDEVVSHARLHPVQGRHGAFWLACAEYGATSTIFELWNDDGVVLQDSRAPSPIDGCNIAGLRWLPLTAALLPAFLHTAAAPTDPTGAPIVHVPTARALAVIEHGVQARRPHLPSAAGGAARDEALVRLLEEAGDLTRVVRERDHHAQRVGELLHDAGWMLARTRALAKLIPEVRCVSCIWAGWPYSCAVHPEGLLLCPECAMPCHDARFAEAPEWLLAWLFEQVADESSRIQRGEGEAVPRWTRVSLCAEALAGFMPDVEGEGRAARRAAVVGALFAGDAARAQLLAERYLGSETLDGDLALELRALGRGSQLYCAESFERKGRWVCCAQPACVCGLGWLRWGRLPDGRPLGGIFDPVVFGGGLLAGPPGQAELASLEALGRRFGRAASPEEASEGTPSPTSWEALRTAAGDILSKAAREAIERGFRQGLEERRS